MNPLSNSLAVGSYVEYVNNYLRPPGSATWTPCVPGFKKYDIRASLCEHQRCGSRDAPCLCRLGLSISSRRLACPARRFRLLWHSGNAASSHLPWNGGIWENQNVVPRAFVSSRVRTVDSRRAAFAHLADQRNRCRDTGLGRDKCRGVAWGSFETPGELRHPFVVEIVGRPPPR